MVDMSIVRRRGAGVPLMQMLTCNGLLLFNPAYSSLGALIARVRNSMGTTSVMYATPPRQTTVPQDPNLSGRSDQSNSSAKSKSEHYVKKLATKFLETTFSTIVPWIERLQ